MSALVPSRRMTAVVVAAFIAVTLGGVGARQADNRTVAVDADDIGGVVTGARGPEAGVFVIAETTNLPTRLIKSVVTDDQGRYLIPDLPQGTYDVWVRGYGLIDSPEGQGHARKSAPADGGGRAEPESGRGVLPRAVLAVAPAGASGQRFPGHWSNRQRHLTQHQEPGRMDPEHRQHRRLHRLPSDGRQGDARDSRSARQVRELLGGVGAARAVGTGRARHARAVYAGRPSARAGDVGETGPIGSPPASCPPPHLRGPRAGSATSSSRCGIGRIRRRTSTMRSHPTSAIRPSTPTGRSTALSKPAPTTCRSSIPCGTRRRRSS